MITKIIDEELIQAAKTRILDAEHIVIVTHASPDGDAIGSSLALSHFLAQIDRDVEVIVPDEMPDFLKWLPGSDDVLVWKENESCCTTLINDADLIIGLDFNALSRINEMAAIVADAKAQKIIVDHHTNPGNFADIIISYPGMCSTCEMIFRLICRMGYASEMNSECATCIYTGMMTDTGSFTYNCINPEVFSIISELIKKGINRDYIYRKIYHNFTVNRLRLEGYILSQKMKVYPEYGLSMIVVSKSELEEYGYQKGDTEGFVNIPLTIKGIVMSVFMREDGDKVKISMRSVGDVQVNKIAADLFGGGGHVNASGAMTTESITTAEELVLKSIPIYEKELKAEIEKQML